MKKEALMARYRASSALRSRPSSHRAKIIVGVGALMLVILCAAPLLLRTMTPAVNVTAAAPVAGRQPFRGPTVLPAGSVPRKVHTAGYLLGYGGAKLTGTQLEQIAPLFDLIETDSPHVAVFKAANPIGKTMLYEDPHRIIHPSHVTTYLTENNYAHCNGTRLEGAYGPKRMNHVDVREPSSSEGVVRELGFRTAANGGGYRWDYWFADDTVRPAGFQCLPDGYSDEEWASADATFLDTAAERANIPVVYNGAAKGSGNIFFSDYLAGKKNVAGGMAETCFSHGEKGNPDGPYIDDVGKYPLWTELQRGVLRLQNYRPKQIFICYSNDGEIARNATDIRTYVVASFLMFYNPQTSYLWELFRTNSTVTLEPESRLVPLSPLRPTPRKSGVSDVASFHCGGAYCREYNDCYYNATLVGYCAVEINATHGPTVSADFPSGRKYTRAMTLSGSGMLTAPGTMQTDDGSVSFNGVPPQSLCSPGTTQHASITECSTAAIVFGPTPSAPQRHRDRAKHRKGQPHKKKRAVTSYLM